LITPSNIVQFRPNYGIMSPFKREERTEFSSNYWLSDLANEIIPSKISFFFLHPKQVSVEKRFLGNN
jgi:hypothetical protein